MRDDRAAAYHQYVSGLELFATVCVLQDSAVPRYRDRANAVATGVQQYFSRPDAPAALHRRALCRTDMYFTRSTESDRAQPGP
jgi:hypothetical protein